MVHLGDADSLICGTFGEYRWHLNYVNQILGRGDYSPHGALSLMILEDGPLFIADTQVRIEPTPEQIAETVIGAARHARRFGIEPKVGPVFAISIWQYSLRHRRTAARGN